MRGTRWTHQRTFPRRTRWCFPRRLRSAEVSLSYRIGTTCSLATAAGAEGRPRDHDDLLDRRSTVEQVNTTYDVAGLARSMSSTLTQHAPPLTPNGMITGAPNQ